MHSSPSFRWPHLTFMTGLLDSHGLHHTANLSPNHIRILHLDHDARSQSCLGQIRLPLDFSSNGTFQRITSTLLWSSSTLLARTFVTQPLRPWSSSRCSPIKIRLLYHNEGLLSTPMMTLLEASSCFVPNRGN